MHRQFLRIQKNQTFDLQDPLENYCTVFALFGSNRALRYSFNKVMFAVLLVKEWRNEPIVIKEANQFVSLKFGDVQLLDLLKFLGGDTSFHSFLKVFKNPETEAYFPYEWSVSPEKLTNTQLLPYEAFFRKLSNKCSPERLSRLSKFNWWGYDIHSNEALSKLKLNQPTATGQENYQFLISVWKHEKMCTFKEILRWYYNKDLLGKINEDMVGGPSTVFTRKAVVGETYTRDPTKGCKTTFGNDVSQRYPHSVCQVMHTALYTRCELHFEPGNFEPRQNKT